MKKHSRMLWLAGLCAVAGACHVSSPTNEPGPNYASQRARVRHAAFVAATEPPAPPPARR